jgi:hypothetical protein
LRHRRLMGSGRSYNIPTSATSTTLACTEPSFLLAIVPPHNGVPLIRCRCPSTPFTDDASPCTGASYALVNITISTCATRTMSSYTQQRNGAAAHWPANGVILLLYTASTIRFQLPCNHTPFTKNIHLQEMKTTDIAMLVNEGINSKVGLGGGEYRLTQQSTAGVRLSNCSR